MIPLRFCALRSKNKISNRLKNSALILFTSLFPQFYYFSILDSLSFCFKNTLDIWLLTNIYPPPFPPLKGLARCKEWSERVEPHYLEKDSINLKTLASLISDYKVLLKCLQKIIFLMNCLSCQRVCPCAVNNLKQNSNGLMRKLLS